MTTTRRMGALAALFLMTGPQVLPAQQPATAGTQVFTIADSLVGGVGGVAVDQTGAIYVADFMETVYKVQPDGRVAVFATGLYGASGNAIGPNGELYQANFHGNSVSRVERDGSHSILARGFQGPVGVAVAPDGGLFVNNCRGNSISRVSPAGDVTEFAASDLFNCPNGLTRHPNGNLYAVNFSDGRMLEIDSAGAVREFAVIPGGGNGHVTTAGGELYVTSFQGQQIYTVAADGTPDLLAGTGRFGEVDGPAAEARFSWPNGLASGPPGDRLYTNDYLNRQRPGVAQRPVPLSSLRMIKLPSVAERMVAALGTGGLAAMEAAYREFKEDPSNGSTNTEFLLNGLGYQLMNGDNLTAAIRVFELNVGSYPSSANVYDSLAEGYMNAGRNDEAIEFYEKSLAINPGNTNATDMIARIRSGD